MDIISKQDGPRREDIQAKRHIRKNWGTITKLADQLSGGGYSANKLKKNQPPQASGLIIKVLGTNKSVIVEPRPYLRITPNGRVAVLDLNTGLQMYVLGQISRKNGQDTFLLATKENGFISTLDPDLCGQLSALDGATINDNFSEEKLWEKLNAVLNLNESEADLGDDFASLGHRHT